MILAMPQLCLADREVSVDEAIGISCVSRSKQGSSYPY